jgi:hypothetical protein
METKDSHSETVQMAVCFQNVPLGALSSRSAPSVLVGALFKKFGLFFSNTPCNNVITIVFDSCIGFNVP